ncbi:MAG: hypothetical protein COB75_08615 [Idiomarina sp.]|jgi:uncharacterized membrane protein|uniref:DUF502 domain-containing protein n=1 Tax=Idiomarina sp. TaxID=1874361 RepID=UPI000C0C8E35|nr:DUF502 domain-containing protein [Idiomarina sp.]MBL4742953.1 DUF502 domain-containing protein [Idiomarina sp.]PHQ72763.1 MAG: hypothetical protein COB75_08615 [Idiomarina sp.]
MKIIIQSLLKGLAILLPIIVTVYLVQWLLVTIETWLSPIWKAVLGETYYFPGLAFISFLVLTVLIGFSTRWRFMNWVWQLPGMLMNKLPLLRSLYGTVNDVFEMMSGKDFAEESVVLVTLPNSETRLIGIVTKKSGDNDDRLSKMLNDDQVAVFLPMSYNVGGYMIMVPKNCVESIDLKPADALQMTISAGLGKNRDHKSN